MNRTEANTDQLRRQRWEESIASCSVQTRLTGGWEQWMREHTRIKVVVGAWAADAVPALSMSLMSSHLRAVPLQMSTILGNSLKVNLCRCQYIHPVYTVAPKVQFMQHKTNLSFASPRKINPHPSPQAPVEPSSRPDQASVCRSAAEECPCPFQASQSEQVWAWAC